MKRIRLHARESHSAKKASTHRESQEDLRKTHVFQALAVAFATTDVVIRGGLRPWNSRTTPGSMRKTRHLTASMDVKWFSVPPRRTNGLDSTVLQGRGTVRWQLTAGDLEKLQQLWGPARGGIRPTLEIRVRQRSGANRWITVKTKFDHLARGSGTSQRTRNAIADEVAVDGRERRPQVARLGRLAVVGRLFGAFAHDLAQPLTSILSNAQAAQRLLSDEPNGEAMRGIITDIISADTHANALIQKVRALLKRRATKLEHVDLADAIHDATNFVSGELAAHRVEVVTHIDPDVPAVKADKVQLEQVLLNLILNAVQAMRRTQLGRRRLLIRVRRVGASVEVAVEDAGKGLRASQLERMFDPFYTTRKSGLGLGLWVCRTIIAAHRGRIWATRNERTGITVHFTLRPYPATAIRQLGDHPGAVAAIRTSRDATSARARY